MDSFDTRRVMDEALDKLNTPRSWLILVGSVAGVCLLKQKGIFSMDSFDTRRMLEKLIDKVGDNE